MHTWYFTHYRKLIQTLSNTNWSGACSAYICILSNKIYVWKGEEMAWYHLYTYCDYMSSRLHPCELRSQHHKFIVMLHDFNALHWTIWLGLNRITRNECNEALVCDKWSQVGCSELDARIQHFSRRFIKAPNFKILMELYQHPLKRQS